MDMKIRPLKSKVLLKLVPVERETLSGLVLVDRKKHWEHKSRQAEVVSVGPWVDTVAPGDRVVILGSAGKWVEPELGETDLYRMVREDEILAVVGEFDDVQEMSAQRSPDAAAEAHR